MSLTLDDMQTFVTLLEQNVTLRKQIKQALFPELDIEQTLNRLTELLERMDRRVAAQEKALAKVQTDVSKLQTDVSKLQTDVSKLQTDVSKVQTDVSKLQTDVSKLQTDVSKVQTDVSKLQTDVSKVQTDVAGLKGKSQEAFYHRRAAAIFGRYIANGREVSNEVANQLQAAFEQTRITDDEYDQILAADMFFGGKLRPTGQEVLLVMEASWYAQVEDVQRAADRAAMAQRGGLPSLPVVGGETWSDEAIALATERAVAMTRDGRLDRASWQRAAAAWLPAD